MKIPGSFIYTQTCLSVTNNSKSLRSHFAEDFIHFNMSKLYFPSSIRMSQRISIHLPQYGSTSVRKKEKLWKGCWKPPNTYFVAQPPAIEHLHHRKCLRRAHNIIKEFLPSQSQIVSISFHPGGGTRTVLPEPAGSWSASTIILLKFTLLRH